MENESQRYLTANQAASYIGISRSTFDGLVKNGTLPSPITLTKRVLRWDREKLDGYLKQTSETDQA